MLRQAATTPMMLSKYMVRRISGSCPGW